MTRRNLLALLAAPAQAAAPIKLEDLDRLGTIEVRAELDHVQGIDVRGDQL